MGNETKRLPARVRSREGARVASALCLDMSRGGSGRGGHGGRGGRSAPQMFAASYVETRIAFSWAFVDPTARPSAEQAAANTADLNILFDRLPVGPMRASISAAAVQAQNDHGHILKEVYLAFGRKCELVFATANGGSSLVLRSNERVLDEHLQPFMPLFDGLPPVARRTGVDGTLHRISRSVHAIRGEMSAITARVGRTIQGHILPLLTSGASGGSEAEVSRAIAGLARRSLLLIGTPNVGKTTALREIARLLSIGDNSVVVIVDKSLEIAGTGVVPHAAIGNARVLTAESPAHQHKCARRPSCRALPTLAQCAGTASAARALSLSLLPRALPLRPARSGRCSRRWRTSRPTLW